MLLNRYRCGCACLSLVDVRFNFAATEKWYFLSFGNFHFFRYSCANKAEISCYFFSVFLRCQCTHRSSAYNVHVLALVSRKLHWTHIWKPPNPWARRIADNIACVGVILGEGRTKLWQSETRNKFRCAFTLAPAAMYDLAEKFASPPILCECTTQHSMCGTIWAVEIAILFMVDDDGCLMANARVRLTDSEKDVHI